MALESETHALERGDAPPSFELPGTDGETYSLADFRDYGALLIVITCNHCPYAQAKIDVMNDLSAEYSDLAVIAINPNDAEAYPEDSFTRMREFVDEGTIQWEAYLRDESQSVAAAYGAMCTPDPFLFRGSGGEFSLAYHGRFDDALNPDEEPSEKPGFEMREAIEAVLAGEEVTLPDLPSRGCSIKWRDGNEPAYWN